MSIAAEDENQELNFHKNAVISNILITAPCFNVARAQSTGEKFSIATSPTLLLIQRLRNAENPRVGLRLTFGVWDGTRGY